MTATKRTKAPPPDGPAAVPVVENAAVLPAVRKKRAPANSASTRPLAAFPIVGIGASAGGLAAIEEFLEALPADRSTQLALVILQHLDPDHESLLLELVKRYTQMDVAWATDGQEVRPGRAYILPPNKDMALVKGRLALCEPELPRGLRLPIDYFFRSLAADKHERAVCIVLSGTGSDGALGLRAIKGEGGLAMAQSPESAAYDGMPRSAVATGLVDFVLAPAEMPAQLLAYVERAFSHARVQSKPAQDVGGGGPLLQVLRLLRDRSGHDFTHYKTNTLRRRVERRMAISGIERMEDYVSLLQHDSVESETLFRELLIGVTNFFRDPAAFDVLAAEVLPRLIRSRAPGDPVRVWVPGCSTGEEAYSIAMLLREQIDALKRNVPVQVFATDIDIESIERARSGVYPESIAADVTAERLERFFVKDGNAHRVVKSVRDSLIFAKQDITRDPPFSRVDLVSCRNLLIYMDVELQQRIMAVFHYALNPDGYLFLGTSETVGGSTDLFAPIDKKWRVFQRRNTVPARQILAQRMPALGMGADQAGRRGPAAAQGHLRVREIAEKALLDKHVPAAVVINADGDVLYIHGHTGRYLEPAVGEPTRSIHKMARAGLHVDLASGIRRVRAGGEPLRIERVKVGAGAEAVHVNLTIEPIGGTDEAKGLLLVLFEDVPAIADVLADESQPAAEREQRIADLDRELTAKEEFLRATVEALETSNEELKSTNEELQSSNEELQSTNEELETSREELQSVNEELVTVNSELQQKIEELSQANNDMSNMLAGTGIGTLFVDRHGRIQRYTPNVSEIMNLIPGDVGRPLGDIASRLKGDTDLVKAVTSVLDTLATLDLKVENVAGAVYQMRAQPYRTLDNVIEGAVLTFVDITEQQRAQDERDVLARAVKETGEFAQSVLDASLLPQLVLDGQLNIVTANKALLAAYGNSAETLVGRSLKEIDDGAWGSPKLMVLLREVLPMKRAVVGYSFELARRDNAAEVTLDAHELLQEAGKRRLILLTVVGGIP